MATDRNNNRKKRPRPSASTRPAGRTADADQGHGRDDNLSVTDQIQMLKSWLAQHGVVYSNEDIEILPSPVGGMGIFSQRDLQKNSTLATIPKSAILSIVNSRLCDSLQALDGAFKRSDQALAFAYADEKKRGADSPFHGYIATVPDYEPIPLLWSDEALGALEGSELKMESIITEREGLWMEYALSIRLLGWVDDKADPEAEACQVSFSEWVAARSLVSSRAFYVDPLHKTAMIPLADVFNHKAAIMDIPEDAVIAEEDEEDEDEDEEDAVRGGKANDKGDSTAHLNAKSECLPFCDDENCFGNCSPTANARTTRSRAADLNINVDWQMTMLRSEDEESLLVTIMSDVPSKVEIFNCYGEKSNGTLLRDYGFCLPRNPFDIVNLDIQLIEDALYDLGFDSAGEARMQKQPAEGGYDIRAQRLMRRKLAKHLGPQTDYVQLEQSGVIPPELVAGLAEVLGVPLQDNDNATMPLTADGRDCDGEEAQVGDGAGACSSSSISIWDDPDVLLSHALEASKLLGDVILRTIQLRKREYALSKAQEENMAKLSLKSCGPVRYLSLDDDYWTSGLRAIKKCEATQVMASRVVFGELSALDLATDNVIKRRKEKMSTIG